MANSATTAAKGPGLRRAAIMLLILEEESAAEVFRHLAPQQIQRISKEMTKLDDLSHAEIKSVLEGFHEQLATMPPIEKYDDYIRSVLTKALGAERANTMIEDVLEQKADHIGIEALNMMDVPEVAEMIRDEHPQIIATILIHLERAQAAGVLEHFDERLRNDVVLRIATFSGVQPAALQELTEVLGGMLDGQSLKRSKMGGVRTAAEILNLLSTGQEDTALENIRAYNDELAQKIIDEMFLFENLIDLDDRSIQTLLRQIETPALVTALKGAPKDLAEKFLRNMSQRAASLVREEMESRGPMRLSQVEAEQKAILQVVRRLADAGDIVLSSGDDAYV
ncbi:flagellar motor switch protein FliG [Pseudidiomarina insulisalsae]|uniref:Flagellar motor switch protein FliG n=1 Tax=Pseudidiomarina insulisalsae TaxID=575789 RepID=A0A432YDV7_9GAMM|nr:flagellar motor switch protein FliG [Pseudidiomarina insulisalsae]RUO59056.1 flagellar motor switch protein FliG [Pseudidiomarina insulisalsae]